MEKIWDFGDGSKKDPAKKLYEQPEIILTEYANRVYDDTDRQFSAIVVEQSGGESNNIFYSLYIFSPRLKDYRYRLIELKVPSIVQPYPTEVTFFAKEPRNNRTYTCGDGKQLRRTLLELITSSHARLLLSHLKTMVEIREHYTMHEEFFKLSKENNSVTFSDIRQPITISKVILKSHLDKEPNAWGRIMSMTRLVVEWKGSDGSTGSQQFSLVSFMSLYQRQPVLAMRLIIPSFEFYKRYENAGLSITIRMETSAEEAIELEVYYDDNLIG